MARAAWMVLLMVCLVPWELPGQTAQQLSQVRKIYVEPLAEVTGSSQLRESLIKRLEKNGTFEVVSD